MHSLTRFAAVFAALAAVAAVPAVANAGTVPMRGVVSGSPYGASNGQMAIPVLFSKQTARNTGLKSPVGVIILKRTQKVKLPNGGGYTLPVNLRTGDRFKGRGAVNALQRRVFYPRIVFPKAVVYFRSKELSLAELSAAVDALRKAIADLQAQLIALKNGTIGAVNSLQAQIDGLRKQLAALQIPTLPDLSGYVKLSDLTALLSGYATKTYVNNAIAGLQAEIDALPTKAYVDAAVAAINSRIDTLCTSVKAATVDPDAGGPLPAVPVTLPGISTACP